MFVIEHKSDYSVEHTSEDQLTGGTHMTITYPVSPRTGSSEGGRRPIGGPAQGPRYARPARSTRPGPSRPAGAPPRYRSTGVTMSVAPHGKRPVSLAATVGLALLAGIITLWLGLVANFGQAVN